MRQSVAMIVKLDGEDLEVDGGLTFAELIAHVRALLKPRVLVELQLNGETVSQALLDELEARPISEFGDGEIALFSLSPRELVGEVVKRGLEELARLERLGLKPETVPELIEGFGWLDRALGLIPLGTGFPELRAWAERLLLRSREFAARLEALPPEELEGLARRLTEQLASYRRIFSEIEERLRQCGGDT
jgi:sulfur carrier protein ThiS